MSENQTDSQESQFVTNKVESKKNLQKVDPKKEQKKVPKKKKQDAKKPPKKKQKSKPKNQGKNQNIAEQVFEYLDKQNRPYNLLNIFDNLHGSIKKPALEEILDNLVLEKKLVSKQFGKNKVYMVNQERYNVDADQMEKLGSRLSQLRQQCSQLQQAHKRKVQQFKTLTSKPLFSQLQQTQTKLSLNITLLKIKKQNLTNDNVQKVDKEVVESIQKQEKTLRKQLNARKKLTKECLTTWSEILEKKIGQTAEIMLVQLG